MAVDSPSGPQESVWTRRLERGPEFSLALGWGPGQVLEAFWRDIFAMVPAGARILEVACGSAQVSLWAAEARRGLRITASDVVETPGAGRSHPDIAFLGGAPAEALPVQDAAFDLTVSNFAIEYADIARALPELARVCCGPAAAACWCCTAQTAPSPRPAGC
jgi:ubiquinone/menaquinone biosynthesis C-methylase UbiE